MNEYNQAPFEGIIELSDEAYLSSKVDYTYDPGCTQDAHSTILGAVMGKFPANLRTLSTRIPSRTYVTYW